MLDNADSLEKALDEALHAFRIERGNKRDDYYGLLFIEHVLRVPRNIAIDQVAFGNHDLGIDGFHLDAEQGSFRVFQFKNSKNGKLFLESLNAMLGHGIPAIFSDHEAVPAHQPIIDSARRALADGKEVISQVFCRLRISR